MNSACRIDTNSNAQARRYFGLEEAANGPAIYVYPAALTDQTGRPWKPKTRA